jgi:sigma-B regulation protein RsbU (phosphoserine phosphatase)
MNGKEIIDRVVSRVSTLLGGTPVALFMEEKRAYSLYSLMSSAVGEAASNLEISKDGVVVRFLKSAGRRGALAIASIPAEQSQGTEPFRDLAVLSSLNAKYVLPIFLDTELSGFACFGELPNTISAGPDSQLFDILSELASFALDNPARAAEAARGKLLTQELVTAREMYEGLFPKTFPGVNGLDCAADCRQVYEIGGDYYDFIMLPDGRFACAIGDVSGKSITAALIMANLRASLRRDMSRHTENLAGLFDHLNELVFDVSPPSRYVTLFYAQYDPRTSRLQYVNGGHPPPILLRRKPFDQSPRFLKEGGTVVGILQGVKFKQGTEILQPGDMVLAFSDGVTEAMNLEGEEWGLERLVDEVVNNSDELNPSELISHLFKKIDEFAAGAKQYDDMSMIVLKAR